jgi:hypothetical protein
MDKKPRTCILAKLFTLSKSLTILVYVSTLETAEEMPQRFKMADPLFITLEAFFSASIKPIVVPELVHQCKANILSHPLSP